MHGKLRSRRRIRTRSTDRPGAPSGIWLRCNTAPDAEGCMHPRRSDGNVHNGNRRRLAPSVRERASGTWLLRREFPARNLDSAPRTHYMAQVGTGFGFDPYAVRIISDLSPPAIAACAAASLAIGTRYGEQDT